ncbi:MAG: fumarylacetoacetate hydrolase family protein [bacterium]|nr:fumarylacetoacetate hydrolase family protein [bacterium]
MRIYRYKVGSNIYYGEQAGDDLLARCVRLNTTNMELKRAGMEDLLSEVELLPPCAPSKIICVGRNYALHAAERGEDVPDQPLLFLKPPSCLLAHGGTIVLPDGSEQVDFEGEIALVINQRCKDVHRANAYDVLLGLTAFNDVSARDWQKNDGQWTRAKGVDTFGPCGPWIDTSAAEALRVGAQMQSAFEAQTGNASVDSEKQLPLTVTTYVNGEQRQHGSISEMVFGFAYLIEYISSLFTLEAGDMIVTGTPAGVGPLASGDEVVVQLSSGPRLVNAVV